MCFWYYFDLRGSVELIVIERGKRFITELELVIILRYAKLFGVEFNYVKRRQLFYDQILDIL